MSELNSIICSQCNGENNTESKFCSHCGMKLEQLVAPVVEQPEVVQPIYEKVEAEVIENSNKSAAQQEEIHINYGSDQGMYSSSNQNQYSNSTYNGQTVNSAPQYYNQNTDVKPKTNGNIGISIASMVCGILSLLCCCLYVFSIMLAIVAIVLGIIAVKNKYDGAGMAIAGIATGAVVIVFVAIMLVFGGFLSMSSFMDSWMY